MMQRREYTHKLDFYYISLIVYFVFLIMYVLMRGSFFESKFQVVFQDPIIYIIGAFIVLFLILLLFNWLRAKRIIFDDSKNQILFKNRWGERTVSYSDIISVKFSRRRRKRAGVDEGRVAKLKLKGRKRLLRIRLNEYNEDIKLTGEFRNLQKRGS